ncbi:hypothetical protein COS75_00065 [Candidatus Pacearchaeota archaeon CG06_land_8_20_14_3_00_35_12]|nr:MAG: hypothetical protein COS75_00065 [Candidatus Pacearchaeota archaeon CG06_land_8_20_14_3_00_35_12]
MNQEAEKRKKTALEINKRIKDLSLGVILVGSVAHSPQSVTKESDLDIVNVIDFANTDFKKYYRRINQQYEPLVAEYANDCKFNTFSIAWNENFEIGIHLWDRSAFENIVNITGYNKIFARENWKKDWKSTAESKTEFSMAGEERTIKKPAENVKGGKILEFYPYYYDSSGLVMGVQTANMIVDPVILSQKDNYISEGIERLIKNFKAELIHVYGANHSENISLLNAFCQRVKSKFSEELKERLKSFF